MKVLSGNELEIEGVRCRLFGVRLPASDDAKHDAWRFLACYIAHSGGYFSICNTDDPVNDKNGVPLVWLSYSSEGWAQEALVRAGFATVDYAGFENYKFYTVEKDGPTDYDWKECLREAESEWKAGKKAGFAFRCPERRGRPAEVLQRIDAADVPALKALLNDEDWLVRLDAAEALGKIGPRAKTTIPDLMRLLKDQNVLLSYAAAEALGKMGPQVIRPLTELLKAKDKDVRWAAMEALRQVGPAAVPALMDLLKDKEDRLEAAVALGNIGPKAKAAIPALMELLKYEHDSATDGSIGPRSVLFALLGNEDDAVHRVAAGALGKIGAAAVLPLNDLLKNRGDGWPFAIDALGDIGPEARTTIPALIELLKDEEDSVRFSAACALRSMGPEAKTAIPALMQLLKDEFWWVQAAAADALGQMGADAKAAVPTLIRLVQEKDGAICREAAEALGSIGPEARDAVPALTRLLKDDSKWTRKSAAEALEKIEKGRATQRGASE